MPTTCTLASPCCICILNQRPLSFSCSPVPTLPCPPVTIANILCCILLLAPKPCLAPFHTLPPPLSRSPYLLCATHGRVLALAIACAASPSHPAPVPPPHPPLPTDLHMCTTSTSLSLPQPVQPAPMPTQLRLSYPTAPTCCVLVLILVSSCAPPCPNAHTAPPLLSYSTHLLCAIHGHVLVLV